MTWVLMLCWILDVTQWYNCWCVSLKTCTFLSPEKLNVCLFYFIFSIMTVCCHVSCICQVPPQRCGRGHILRADCAVGQQKQQEDARAEDSPVSSSTYGTLNNWHSGLVLYLQFQQKSKITPSFSLQHPVYCVNVVGTQNANNLISISTDGKMCSWSLDMLSQPQVFLHTYIQYMCAYMCVSLGIT